jgi:hypothetical protein
VSSSTALAGEDTPQRPRGWARFLSVEALVRKPQRFSLRRFKRSPARRLPDELILRAAFVGIPAGQLLVHRQPDGGLAFVALWTRFGWCREAVGGRLVDEALMLAREVACTRLSSRVPRVDVGFQAALRARSFSEREGDEGELIFELAGQPS